MEPMVVPLVVYTTDGQRHLIGHANIKRDWTFEAVVTDEVVQRILAKTNESMHFSVGVEVVGFLNTRGSHNGNESAEACRCPR